MTDTTNFCLKHPPEPIYKSLKGTCIIEGKRYTYKVCPICFPARLNVHNMLRELHQKSKI